MATCLVAPFSTPTVVAVGARRSDSDALSRVLADAVSGLRKTGTCVLSAAQSATLQDLSFVAGTLSAGGGGVVVVPCLSSVAAWPAGPCSTSLITEWLAAVVRGDLVAAFDLARVPLRARPTRPPSAPVSVLAGTELRDLIDPDTVAFAGGTRLLSCAAHTFTLDATGVLSRATRR